MGTWTTDIAGQGLCHTRPLSRAERARQRQIARRWKMWEPLLLHDLRRADAPVAAELPRLRQVHARTMHLILDAGLGYAAINRDRNVKLDDPRLTDEERAAEMAGLRRKSLMLKRGRGKKVSE
jgi:hypothetical protein